MAIINISGTISSSFTTSGVLVNAAQAAGDAIFTIDLRETPPIAIVQDNLDYGNLGWNINDAVAVVTLVGPQGDIYRNEDYNSPDIVPGTSRFINKDLPLGLDPETNYENILKGNYTLKISWYNSTLDEYYSFLKTFQYDLDPATIENTTVSGPYTGVLKSTDTTDYGNDVHQIIREHRVQYPTQLDPLPSDIVSSNAEVQVTPIYTNEWTVIINSFVEYRMTDELRIYWEGTGTFTHCVYGGCIGAMYDAIETMLTTYREAMACNLNNQEAYQKRLVIVNNAWHLLNEAYWSGDAEEADEQAYIIQEQVAYTGSGTCGGATSYEVIPCPPWTGGGVGGTYTFSNGLTEAAGDVHWGGILTEDTTITMAGYQALFTGANAGNTVSLDISTANGVLQKSSDGTTEGRVYVEQDLVTLEYADLVTPANTKGYEVGPNGLVEKADYSSGYGNLSLVNKAYVDALFSGSASYAFENGLTESGGTVKLGGDITEATRFDMDAQTWNTYGYDNQSSPTYQSRYYQGSHWVAIESTTFTSYPAEWNDTAQVWVQFEGTTIALPAATMKAHKRLPSNDETHIQVSTAGITILDENNSVGMTYEADYSTLGTTDDRWIPDWGAVKAYADGASGVSTFVALTDTPGSFAGFGGYFVRVNSGATALEFVSSAWVPATGGTFTGQVTIATSTDSPLIIQQIGAGSTPGVPEGGTNLIEFQDNDGDVQGYIGIDASGNIVFGSYVTGGGILVQDDLEVNGDIIVTGVVDGVDIAAFKSDYDTNAVNWDEAYSWGDHAGLYQPLDADLTSIAGLGFTADAFLKKSAADTWYLDTEVYASLSYVNSLALTYVYVPDSMNVVTSDGYTGTVTNVQTLDATYVQIEEATGTPGFEARFEFVNVVAFNNVFLYLYYPGGATHQVDIQLFNNDTLGWDTIYSFTDETGFTIIDIPIALDDDYINVSDEVTLRLYHTDAGNTAHFIQVDYIALRQTPQLGGGGGISDHGGLTGLDDDDHTQYALADGSRCTYYIPYASKSSATDEGYLGQTSIDDDYIYVCVVAGVAGSATWKKIALNQSP